MNKTGCSSALHRSIMFLQAHHVVWTSQILFLGKVLFFSILMAELTYWPLVRDSNPDIPFSTALRRPIFFFQYNHLDQGR